MGVRDVHVGTGAVAVALLVSLLPLLASGCREEACSGPKRGLRYTGPGCGAAAPAAMCVAIDDDRGCAPGWVCGCDGQWVATCRGPEHVAPWGHYSATPRSGACDPARAPEEPDARAAPADGPAADRSPGDGSVDGESCLARGGVWRHYAAGCGPSAPPPVCGTPGVDGGLGPPTYVCACDGVTAGTRDGWLSRPWAYVIANDLATPGARCDPGRPASGIEGPDGGMCGGRQELRHVAPGCGAAAPAPACVMVDRDAGCRPGWVCNCDGAWIATCSGAQHAQPWASFSATGPTGTCDPTRPPDGGAR